MQGLLRQKAASEYSKSDTSKSKRIHLNLRMSKTHTKPWSERQAGLII